MAPRPIDIILRNVLEEAAPFFDVDQYYGRPPVIVLVGRFKAEAADRGAVERHLASRGYYTRLTPLPRGQWLLEVSPRPMSRSKRRWIVNLVLFVATIGTTVAAGTMMSGASLMHPANWLKGVPFSAALMGILLCHEMGHFVASLRHKVRATLPYFLPFPNMFGTWGALIRMESPIPDRRALLDIGAAGPLSGFLVALPITVIGLHLSRVVAPGAMAPGTMLLGDSLLFKGLTYLIKGPLHGGDVMLHPLALAGWIGLFVTAVNLLPIGQLDGGHVSYALFGKWSIWVARAAFVALVPLAFVWNVWLLWALLILLFVRLGHPPPLDDKLPLTPARRAIGVIVLVIFVLTFMPAPIRIL